MNPEMTLVWIKMLENKMGSPDGARVQHYEKDQEYEVTKYLAKVFVEERAAVYIDAPAEGDTAEKAEKAPKNKAEKAPKNKADAEADA